MRAGPLADGRVKDLLNARFIPLYFDQRPPERGPDFRKRWDTLRDQVVAATGDDVYIHLAVFRPSGQLLHAWPHHDKWQVEPVLGRLEALVEEEGLGAGPPVFPALTAASRRVRPDDLVLETTGRFLVTPEQARAVDPVIRAESPPGPGNPPPNDLVLHRVKSPSQDWVVVPREAWSALLDPGEGAEEADSWEVRGEPALALVRDLVPPNAIHLLGDERLLDHTLTVTRAGRVGPRETLRLTGRVVRNHPYWAKTDDDLAEARFCGYLEVDREAGALLSFHLVTLDGRYRGRSAHPSLDLPWGVGVVGHVPGAPGSADP